MLEGKFGDNPLEISVNIILGNSRKLGIFLFCVVFLFLEIFVR